MPGVFIAIPAYGDIKPACAGSLMRLVRYFTRAGVSLNWQFLGAPDVAQVRNVLAFNFLKTDYSHLLFIDSDIGFQPKTVQRMHASGEDFIGCVYPRRSEAGGFVIWLDGEKLAARGDSAYISGVGMGLCLISRKVFETLIAAKTLRTVLGADGQPTEFGFFDRLVGGTGTMISEDLSFCRRWRETGGKVCALLAEPIQHVGDHIYTGKYLDHIGPRVTKAQ